MELGLKSNNIKKKSYYECISNLLKNRSMEIVSEKDKEFVEYVEENLMYALENHQIFIASLYDLLDRTTEKLQFTSEDYNQEMLMKNKIRDNFNNIKTDFKHFQDYSDQVLNFVYEDFIRQQVTHCGECESSYGKPQKQALGQSFMEKSVIDMPSKYIIC